MFFGHRAYQDLRPEEKLIADLPGGPVLAEVHHQRTLNGRILAGYLPGQRVNVGQQPVAQLVEGQQRGIDAVIDPHLVLRPVSVGAKDRAEDAVLEPASIKLLVGRVI